jgi:DAACS family dicarboxylate/amino acid:cation (Na+ or H+) symporter
VPGGTLPIIAAVLASLGVDPEKTGVGIALILGVDRFLDMCRTSVNVTGDLVIAAVTDRLSGSGVKG